LYSPTPQAFESVNTKITTTVQSFLDTIDVDFTDALQKASDAADKLSGVVDVAKSIANNEVFIAVVDGLEKFNNAIKARVKFTIPIGRICIPFLVSGISSKVPHEDTHAEVSCSPSPPTPPHKLHLVAWLDIV
jgi:hypothetical protein